MIDSDAAIAGIGDVEEVEDDNDLIHALSPTRVARDELDDVGVEVGQDVLVVEDDVVHVATGDDVDDADVNDDTLDIADTVLLELTETLGVARDVADGLPVAEFVDVSLEPAETVALVVEVADFMPVLVAIVVDDAVAVCEDIIEVPTVLVAVAVPVIVNESILEVEADDVSDAKLDAVDETDDVFDEEMDPVLVAEIEADVVPDEDFDADAVDVALSESIGMSVLVATAEDVTETNELLDTDCDAFEEADEDDDAVDVVRTETD